MLVALTYINKSRTQPIPKRNKRIGILPQTNVPAPIRVESIEQTPPRGQEAP